MEENKKQWIAAFCMGALLPGLVFRIATSASVYSQIGRHEVQKPAAQSTQPKEQIEEIFKIPVLHGQVVEMLDMDAYLTGVLLAEMPPDFHEQALMAQAVAARTCTLQCVQGRQKHEGNAICTDPGCCQAYMSPEDYRRDGGEEEKIRKVSNAVSQTAGEYLTYEGKLIEATYFSCSGGRTEDAVAVWGTDVPYLQSVESPGEEQAEAYTNTVTFTAEQLEKSLGRTLAGDPMVWLGQVQRTRGGGVATMVLAGKTYTGTELRSLLGLYSTAFTMQVKNGLVEVTTSGRGHRVGMSQYGAQAMAQAGNGYAQILSYYYPGTELTNMVR